jgi:hypothetical protein
MKTHLRTMYYDKKPVDTGSENVKSSCIAVLVMFKFDRFDTDEVSSDEKQSDKHDRQ